MRELFEGTAKIAILNFSKSLYLCGVQPINVLNTSLDFESG